MLLGKLKDFLENEGVPFVALSHIKSYTAQETAARAHIPGKELAKTVMVKIDGRMAMAVLPAPEKVDLEHLKAAAAAGKVELADEAEFRGMFPGCELGAMPPFGNLYGMGVYADTSLTADEDIWFNAGSHTDLLRLSYRDFEKLVHPRVAHIAA